MSVRIARSVLCRRALSARSWSSTAARSSSTPPAPPAVASTNQPAIPPRDHRDLAIQQELYTTSVYSPGSPLFLPHGAHVFNKLLAFLRAQYRRYGFQEVLTPNIYRQSLWEQSGHWANYRDDMYQVTGRGASGSDSSKEIGQDEAYGLKPMNCPGHCLLFRSKSRGYRELPVRYADFGSLHRNEVSGALSGLTRVRRFHQDDGHIFCRPDQVSDEISSTLDFVALVYRTLRLPAFKLRLSTRPADGYVGSLADWDRAEEALTQALRRSGQAWTVKDGDGAFYGPKIDIILRDSDGKEHQTATIQLDFQLPQRFGLQYHGPGQSPEQVPASASDTDLGLQRPVIIHRAVLGSLERFMALLLEHYDGRWPFWLSPRQAIVLPVTMKSADLLDYAGAIADELAGRRRIGAAGQHGSGLALPIDAPSFAVELDDSDRSLKKKVSEAKRRGFSFILVVGPRSRDLGTVDVDVTGQVGQEASRLLLADMVGAEAIGDGRAVSLSRAQVRRLFCDLSDQYQ